MKNKQKIVKMCTTIYAGKAIQTVPHAHKQLIANQALPILASHVASGHMVKQTKEKLIEFMKEGLASAVMVDSQLMAFAKLYPYVATEGDVLGYEFSTWFSSSGGKGYGTLALVGAIKAYHDKFDPQADLFAVCSSDNPMPLRILLSYGGTIIKRPSYVPNMLAAQEGETDHPETIIDMKGMITSSLYQDYVKQQNLWGDL